jgi:hypothetical protein
VRPSSSCESIRRTVRTLLETGQPRLHCSSESSERTEKIVGARAQIDMTSVGVIGTPLPNTKQERARAVRMESVALLLAANGRSGRAARLAPPRGDPDTPLIPCSTGSGTCGTNLTAYDAGYVALAQALDGPLVTADARLGTAPGHRCTITLVPH